MRKTTVISVGVFAVFAMLLSAAARETTVLELPTSWLIPATLTGVAIIRRWRFRATSIELFGWIAFIIAGAVGARSEYVPDGGGPIKRYIQVQTALGLVGMLLFVLAERLKNKHRSSTVSGHEKLS